MFPYISAGLRSGRSGGSFPCRVWEFSLHHRVQTCSGAHPASYPVGTRGSFSGGKAAGAWSYFSRPFSSEVKDDWSYTSTPQYAFMACCSIKSTGTTLCVCVHTHTHTHTRVYPKVSGLASWSENCKWYSSLPLCAVVSLFCELV
jgi:hypothetical protein